MEPLRRPELDAKLETVEARMEGHVASIKAELRAHMRERVELDKRMALLAADTAETARRAEATAEKAASLKTHFWASIGVHIAALISLCIGAYYANQQSMLGIAQLIQSGH